MQPNAANAFRNLCFPTSIATHICEFPLLTDHTLQYSKQEAQLMLTTGSTRLLAVSGARAISDGTLT